ncbi:MAG: class I SAM-dependent DNA methyltransferase, partial [Planctomycetota bacterium]
VDAYRRVLARDPGYCRAYLNLVTIAYGRGRLEEATDLLRRWIEQDPGDPTARHLLAACSGEEVPARAGDEYVRQEFDGFARGYDRRLERLVYRGPELVLAAVRESSLGSRDDLTVLDAGCGTGLCGPRLRPFARRLVGVDLSEGMLGEARGRGSYDELVAAELTEHLRGSPAAYDAIVAADTFNYFGPLEELFAAAALALRPSGVMVFTLEHLETEGDVPHRLIPQGRYRHTEGYVRATLGEAGFAITSITRGVLRKEAERPVTGLLIAAERS